MLKPEMIEKLNEQMNLELYSSLLYQQMSAWCSYHTFEGAAAFLRRHAQEEMTHMQRLFDYLTDTAIYRVLIPLNLRLLNIPHLMNYSRKPINTNN